MGFICNLETLTNIRETSKGDETAHTFVSMRMFVTFGNVLTCHRLIRKQKVLKKLYCYP